MQIQHPWGPLSRSWPAVVVALRDKWESGKQRDEHYCRSSVLGAATLDNVQDSEWCAEAEAVIR